MCENFATSQLCNFTDHNFTASQLHNFTTSQLHSFTTSPSLLVSQATSCSQSVIENTRRKSVVQNTRRKSVVQNTCRKSVVQNTRRKLVVQNTRRKSVVQNNRLYRLFCSGRLSSAGYRGGRSSSVTKILAICMYVVPSLCYFSRPRIGPEIA